MQGKCGSVHNRKMIFIQSGKKCDKIKSNYSVGNCEGTEQLRKKEIREGYFPEFSV